MPFQAFQGERMLWRINESRGESFPGAMPQASMFWPFQGNRTLRPPDLQTFRFQNQTSRLTKIRRIGVDIPSELSDSRDDCNNQYHSKRNEHIHEVSRK